MTQVEPNTQSIPVLNILYAVRMITNESSTKIINTLNEYTFSHINLDLNHSNTVKECNYDLVRSLIAQDITLTLAKLSTFKLFSNLNPQLDAEVNNIIEDFHIFVSAINAEINLRQSNYIQLTS